MPTSTIDTAIRTQIDQFLTSISHLVRQAAVEAVKDALGATDGKVAGPARRSPGRPRRVAAAAPAGTKRTRRSAADLDGAGAKVLAYVKANPGSRLEEIGRGLGTETAGLKGPVKALLAAGQLRTEGQKRGTKYLLGSGKAPRAKAGKKAGKRKAGTRAGKRAKKK